ncbi:hypothetical protein B0H19DRAFT_1195546 [Mycena capillaripes]|nr:hypothetical protein B0H19DRAFT_1195546 [Mycena capillaripes]
MMKPLNMSRPLTTEKILSILVESGFMYSVFWFTQVITYIDSYDRDSPWWYVYDIVGLYPTLIIVIVNFHRTLWDEAPATTGDGAAFSTLRWAHSEEQSGRTDTFRSGRRANLEADGLETKGAILMRNIGSQQPGTEDVQGFVYQ